MESFFKYLSNLFNEGCEVHLICWIQNKGRLKISRNTLNFVRETRQISDSQQQGKKPDRSGIRTRATVVTGALNQRLRPLGHPALLEEQTEKILIYSCCFFDDLTELIYSYILNRIGNCRLIFNNGYFYR